MTIIDAIGFVAAGLVFLTFWMKTLMALRIVAIASNVAFATYGFIADLTPIVMLHMLLLPLNVFRTWEQLRLMKRVEAALSAPPQIETLLPHMTARPMTAGTVIFRKGDAADCLYYIDRGSVRIPEFGVVIPAGGLFGEVGLFNRSGTRTGTAVMETDGTLCEIDRPTIMRLCRTQPDFGLSLSRILADRIAAGPGKPGIAATDTGRPDA
ncbi:cyclic nucleotide-binding domain-containing protein [Rhodobacterales bacterium HKCCSP123]|nr:cyclic nucleotide-binding domain-containing protein [Rhodobacterales bacterium HKCCSP123]